MPLRISALLIFLPSLTVPISAQQQADNPWDVIGGYVCSQTDGNSALEKLYLLPDMTWSRNAPFTSFAAMEHPSYSYSFRQPENLPDRMLTVTMRRRMDSYKMMEDEWVRVLFLYAEWKPRVFGYAGSTLRLYTVEKPRRRSLLGRPELSGMVLFSELGVDPVSHDLIETHALIGRQSSLRCRRESLFQAWTAYWKNSVICGAVAASLGRSVTFSESRIIRSVLWCW